MAVSATTGVRFADQGADSFFTNILREDYRPGVIDTLNNTNFLWNYLGRRTPDHVEGKHWVFSIHSGRSEGHGAIGPGAALPDPGKQRFDRWRGPVRHHYGRIQIGSIVDLASATGVATFMQVLDQEIRGLTEDMTREQNRMLQNDGSGRLAEVLNTVSSGTTLDVRLAQIPESPGTMTGMDATNFLRVNQRIAVVNSGTDTVVQALTIASIVDADTVTVNETIVGPLTAGFFIVSNNTDTNLDITGTGYKREPMGLAGILSDANPLAYDGEDAYDGNFSVTSFQNIDRTAAGADFASANILDGGGTNRPPHEMLIQTALTRTRKVNNGITDIMYSSLELQDAYGALLISDRRYINITTLSGGWSAVDYAGIPWMADRDAYPNRLMFLETAQLPIHELAPYDWETRDHFLKRLENNDAWQAMFRGHWNLIGLIPNKMTLLSELSQEVTT